MMKKKLETEVRVEVDSLSVPNLLRMGSDVEFLSEMDVGDFDFSDSVDAYRYIQVSGGSRLYSLKYLVEIYSSVITNDPIPRDRNLVVLDSKEYTHAQIREMRGYQKRKQKKVE